MDIKLSLIVAVMHLIALASPGPDAALVIRTSLQHTRTVALAAVFGISVAILIHSVLSLSGISLLIQKNAQLYMLLQVIGGGYLAWIGFDLIKQSMVNREESEMLSASHKKIYNASLARKAFIRGFISNIFNPKVLIFFISLLSTLVTPEHPMFFRIALAVQIFIMCFVWFSFIAVFFSKDKVQRKFDQWKRIVDRVSGTIFIAFAAVILWRFLMSLH